MKRLLGGIMMAVGALIAGASGLCSVGGLLITLGNLTQTWNDTLGLVAVVLLIGGIPFAIGLGLFFGGRALVQSPPIDDTPGD